MKINEITAFDARSTAMLPPLDPTLLLDRGDITASIVAGYYRAYTAYAGAAVGSATASVAHTGELEPIAEPLSEVSIGSSASAGKAARRARWRKNKKERQAAGSGGSSVVTYSAGAQSGDPSGGCYGLLMVNKSGVTGTQLFGEMLFMPRSAFVSDGELAKYSICRTGDGMYHVTKDVGVPVMDTLKAIADRSDLAFGHGTFGAALLANPLQARVPDQIPRMSDVLGMPTPVSQSDRVKRITHVVVVDVSEPDNLAMLAQLALQPSVFVAIVMVCRPVAVAAVPYGRQYSFVERDLLASGMDHLTVKRVMIWAHGADFRDVAAMPGVGCPAMVGQAPACHHGDQGLYRAASVYRMQEYLATAGVDLESVMLLDSEHQYNWVMSHGAQSDDYCMSMRDAVWQDYVVIKEAAAREMYETGTSPSVGKLVDIRRHEMRRLARGEIVIPRMKFSAWMAQAVAAAIDVVVAGSFTPVAQIVEGKRVRALYAAAGYKARIGVPVAEQFNILADNPAFWATVKSAERNQVPVSILTVDVAQQVFRMSKVEMDDLRRRHGSSVLFDRWGVRVGACLHAYDLVSMCGFGRRKACVQAVHAVKDGGCVVFAPADKDTGLGIVIGTTLT